MILPNLRQRLTPADIDLVIRVLSRGDPRRLRRLEQRVAEQGIEELLDDRALPALLRAASSLASPSPTLFVYVTVRRVLREMGIDHRGLADYLGAMILDFGIRGRAFRIAPHDDEEFRYLTDIVAAIGEEANRRRGFLLRAHLGNFSLWIAGMFPDYITTREQRKGAPGLGYYDAMGARGFRLASDHHLARQLDLAELYDQVASAFPRLRTALNQLSDRHLFPRHRSTDRLLRQVADEFRWRQ